MDEAFHMFRRGESIAESVARELCRQQRIVAQRPSPPLADVVHAGGGVLACGQKVLVYAAGMNATAVPQVRNPRALEIFSGRRHRLSTANFALPTGRGSRI